MSEDVRATNELIERLRRRLTPQGQEVLEQIERIGEERFRERISETEAQLLQERAVATFGEASPSDQETIRKVFGLKRKAHEQLAAAHEREQAHATAALEIFRRAAELDETIGEHSTVREAVAVLERHGEQLPVAFDRGRIVVVPKGE